MKTIHNMHNSAAPWYPVAKNDYNGNDQTMASPTIVPSRSPKTIFRGPMGLYIVGTEFSLFSYTP